MPDDQRLDVLTKASIVQAEAGSVDDMGKVARVLDNRLADGMPLQLDTTVNYANGKAGVTTTAQDRRNPSPYNTYLHAGLPPGAISNPGRRRCRQFWRRRPATGASSSWSTRRPVTRGSPRRPRSTRRTSCSSRSGCGSTRTDEDRPVRAAVLGRPIAHSLSPLLHRAAYAALGLTDWTYDALDVGAEELPDLIAGLGPEWRGFSVTMPCKQAAVEVADVVEPLPRMLGAANTLVRIDGGWRAENTDVVGIGMALQVGDVDSAPRAVILGAGGTASAAAVALASLGAEHIEIVVREPARAADLVRLLDRLAWPRR